ncbi:MAG TPA: M48 family metallopeptidase [Synergistaceae bacterium]|nr:M48 family metallopeptidase [Synergistaceae bacterium]HQH77900.1 M48 family metallopeptidase [Synergistaceae bacterium]
MAALLLCLLWGSWAEALTSDDEKEIAFGCKIAETVDASGQRVGNPAVLARLAMVGKRLTPFLTRDLPFEIRCISLSGDRRPNAFALPGGIVYVTESMLDFVRSDAELAGVLAHELVHTDRKHGMIQSARNSRLSLLSLLVAVASRGEVAAMVLANLVQVAIMGNYSQDLEEEADRQGLDLLRKGEYDPAAMVTLLERLEEERLKHPYLDPGVYQDHPDTMDRVNYIIETMRDLRWPLHRKGPLNLLRVRGEQEGTWWILRVDGDEVWRCPAQEWSSADRRSLTDALDGALQLELPPADLEVVSHPQGSFLRLGQVRLLGEPLPPGSSSLKDFRQAIVRVLDGARRKHPLGQYLK